MYMICDSSYKDLLHGFDNMDTDDLEVAVVELELMDLDDGDCNPDPKRGLNIALAYVKQGKPVIILGEREYSELEMWNTLFLNDNVFFSRKPLTKECFLSALRKILPDAAILP
ncbi:hypothetical protein LLG96_17265 [bacterium]|nr:hypothetical protein [bacterium]